MTSIKPCLVAIIFVLLCAGVINAAPPKVLIFEGPQQGSVVSGEQVGFTFQAQGGGGEVTPFSGPLILVAAGDPSTLENSHWAAIENMANIVYRGFIEDLGYSHEDIYYFNQKSEQDYDGDGHYDEGIVDSTDLSLGNVLASITTWAKGHYTDGQTLYLWLIGHGGPYGDQVRLTLSKSKDAYLDDLSLHNSLAQFQIDTGCQSQMIFIESCYAGLFIHQLSGPGRKLILSAKDKYVHYSFHGTQSFTSLMMDFIGIPISLKDAFTNVKMTLKNRTYSGKQNPLIEVDGDGISSFSEINLLDKIYVGGFKTKGYEPPEIVSHTPSGEVDPGTTVSLSMTTKSSSVLQSAWAAIVRPDYDPEKLAAYFEGTSDTYDEQIELLIFTEQPVGSGVYKADWKNVTLSGRYEVTYYIKDQEGLKVSKGPVIFQVGDAPFVNVQPDKLLYRTDEVFSASVSIGGEGTGDVYFVLLGPEGFLRCLVPGTESLMPVPITDPTFATLPQFGANQSFSSFSPDRMYSMDLSAFPEGEYQWWSVLTYPGTNLLDFNWYEGYTVTYFFVESVVKKTPLPKHHKPGPSMNPRIKRALSEYSYSWYLEGVEPSFSNWTNFTSLSQSTEYTHLAEGSYTFHVRGKTTSNEVSEETIRNFKVSSMTPPKSVETLFIRPGNLTLSVFKTSTLKGIGRYTDQSESDMTSACKWSSSNPQVAAVDASGLVTALMSGDTQIIARYSGFEASISVTVLGGGNDPIVSGVGKVLVSPQEVYLESFGATSQLSAEAIFTDGRRQRLSGEVPNGVWSSTDPGILSVDSKGLLTAISNGTVTVSCGYGGQTGTTSVIVDAPVLSGLRFTPSTALALTGFGETQSVTAYAVYSKGADVLVSDIATWWVDDPEIVIVDSLGNVTAKTEGTTTLYAGFGEHTAAVQVVVTFPHPALWVSGLAFDMTAESGTDGSGLSFQIGNIGTGQMVFRIVESIDWLSVSPETGTLNGDETLTLQITPLASGLSAGRHTDVFTVISEGATYSPLFVTVNMTVTEKLVPRVTGIGITPSNLSLTSLGQTAQLSASATYSDMTVMALTPQTEGVSWSSDDITVADVSNTGLVSAVNDGTVTIYCSYGGVSGVADVTVQTSTSVPVNPPSGDSYHDSYLNADFVLIPAGTFMMGSPSSEAERESDEVQHEVQLSQSYYMQTTEVTQGQWESVMGGNPSYFSSCGDDCPVESVSWNDIQEFITKLNDQGTGTYRLPTEAEWEYAARAGTTTPFSFGECLSTDQANYDGNYPYSGCTKGEDRNKTTAVGSFSANAWGLYDMHGNVWEWCQDWYGDYPSGSVTDPQGPDNGSNRVMRGGSWDSLAGGCRSAIRNWIIPSSRFRFFGFRLVRLH